MANALSISRGSISPLRGPSQASQFLEILAELRRGSAPGGVSPHGVIWSVWSEISARTEALKTRDLDVNIHDIKAHLCIDR